MALDTNLVSYWKLDETSGNASDSVGSNTLTNTNTVGYASALINNGADFGTANTDKSLSTTSTLGINGGAVAISIWVKMRTEIGSGIQTFVENATSTGTFTRYSIDYDYNGGTRRLRFTRTKSGVAAQTVDYNVTLGTADWYHLVLTYDTTNIKGFVNGASVGTTAASGNGSSGAGGTYLGKDNLGSYSSIYLDEVGIWNRALSADEVAMLYDNGNGNQYEFDESLKIATVAYYKLEDLTDTVGSNDLSQPSNAVTYAVGKINNAAVFNGSAYVSAVDSASLSITGDMTLACWVNFDSLTGSPQLIAKRTSTGNQRSYNLFYNNSTGKIQLTVFSDGSTDSNASVSWTPSTGTWYHLSVVYTASAGSADFYVNGSQQGTTQTGLFTAIYDSTSPLSFGCLFSPAQEFFTGKIDEAGIWDAALTSGDITTLYNSGSGLAYGSLTAGLLTDLVSYWAFDETNGDAADSHGANTLTNNAVTFSAAKIDNGAVFNGTSNYLSIADDATLKPTGPFSVSFWAKTSDASGSNYPTVFQSYSQNTAVAGFEIMKSATSQKLRFVVGKNTGTVLNTDYAEALSTSTINDGNWKHFVCVYNGSNIVVYTNGSAGTPTTWTGGIAYKATNYVRVGSNNLTGTDQYFWNGSLDEVSLWNRALSSDEVTDLYSSGAGTQYPFLLTPALTTDAVSNIDLESVTFNGNVTDDNGATVSARGFVYATTTDPTLSDTVSTVAGTTGTYSANITGLTAETTYYVRAYATNSVGTRYGNNVSFTTLAQSTKVFSKDISATEGATYAVSCNVTGSTGTVTVKLGTTGTTSVIPAGTGVSVFQGTYNGLTGLIFESSDGFDGTVDDVMWVLVLGTATIDWTADSLVNVFPIDSSVTFKRIEDQEITRFNLYRYLDVLFKDLDGYVTLTIVEESNDGTNTKSKEFVIGNTDADASAFVKKRISMLSKNQALKITLSNAKLNEAFTVCQYSVSGTKESSRLYKLSKIISI